jgi:hypothetical protein
LPDSLVNFDGLAKLPFEPGFEISGLDLVMLKSARPHSV